MTEDDLIGREKRYEAVFSKKPMPIVDGDGVYVYDDDGNEYIDMGASYGVMGVGHSNPRVVEAIEEQARSFTYAQASYATPERGALMEALMDATPDALDRIFLANAGTEANEAAMKFARGSTDGSGIVSAKRGFHGRTYGSISATWKSKYREPFAPTVPGFDFASYNDVGSLKETVDDETALVLLEPIQGEGGIYPAEADYLEAARDLCDDHDAYLVFDEIQAGMGRTGKMWAHEGYDVTPDALTTAKSLGGGLPISAIVCREGMTEIPKGSHGGTYCGNPVAVAAARAAVEYTVEENLPANAERMGERLVEGVEALDTDRIVDVRGEGLMVGIQVRGRAGRYLSGLAGEGVLGLTAGRNVIRFLPPLTLEEEHIDAVVDALGEVIG
ncbi:aspartate aminotransferase family protein [Haladaptatus sp. F3-133]|jgi:acetylornithine/LysW-gamma-L-lysine aminotransferase|uniref:Aspartate aminotransferase family protein n=1 Tax=Halorutilus salinus TaxID=2487751 RepID=A0A9Q4C3H5_9EURY|nr:aspartate aminotransferase family protein [Halorutilus salinus]MCX2819195.1 aspartate aminotransferase family protein [Halorutilus salinus]